MAANYGAATYGTGTYGVVATIANAVLRLGRSRGMLRGLRVGR